MPDPDTVASLKFSADQTLLVESGWLMREGHRTLAVLAAMKACDVVIVRAVRKKLDDTNQTALFASLRESTGGFDLRQANSLQLYETLTGHAIQREATEIGIWSKYLDALNTLDKVLYDAADIQRDDAAALIDIARRFIEMVTKASGL